MKFSFNIWTCSSQKAFVLACLIYAPGAAFAGNPVVDDLIYDVWKLISGFKMHATDDKYYVFLFEQVVKWC